MEQAEIKGRPSKLPAVKYLRIGRRKNQKKAAIEGGYSTPTLPFDIIYSILSRLPVKSLLRFRCVCKSWRLLVSQPEFIKTHLNQSIKLERQILFYQLFLLSPFSSTDYEISNKSEENLYFLLKKYKKVETLGSCNGLVLLNQCDDGKTCILWNPSTGAYKQLSSPIDYIAGGLCYDSSIDDYKVVLFSRQKQNVYVVYSFKKKSWTEAREFSYFPDYNRNSINVSGVFHLQVMTDVGLDTEEGAIFFFDAVNDEFKEVSLPICIESNRHRISLMDVKGCLGLFYRPRDCGCAYDENHHCGEVWVMREHGDMNSWTQLRINCPYLNYCSTTSFCVTERGQIVTMVDKKLAVYYDDERVHWYIYPDPEEFGRELWIDNTHNTNAVSVVDSLVFPPS